MWKRLSSLFRRSQLDRELTEEIETHLAMHEEIFRRQGMTPEAARLAARREFGGVAQTMEAYRDRRGIRWLETCLADLRYALRGLRLSPGFAAAAIGTLALGIAVNTTIFSVVDAVLLRPLPYRNADRLELLWTTYPKQNAFELPTGYPNIQDWRQARSFEAMAWFRDEPVALKEGPEPEQVDAAFVSPDFFGMLGVQPALGRFFTAAESERGEHLLVLDYGLWQRRFGGSRAVLRESLTDRVARCDRHRCFARKLPSPETGNPALDAAHLRHFFRLPSHRAEHEVRLERAGQTSARSKPGTGPG